MTVKDFLGMEERKTCWEHRDNYYDCVDKYAPNYNRNNQNEKEPKECLALRKLFVQGCPSQWVRHFDRRRTYDQFRERMEKGFDPLKEATTTK